MPNFLKHLRSRLWPSTSPAALFNIPWWLRVALACLGGVCVFLAYPDFNLFYMAYFALCLQLWAFQGLRPRQAFWLILLAGTITNLGGFYWISNLLVDFGHMSLWLARTLCVVLSIAQGMAFALWAYITQKLSSKHVAVTGIPVFLAVEMLWPMLFPWYLGNSQYNFIPAVQVADILGVLGITLLILCVNFILYEISLHLVSRWRKREYKISKLFLGLAGGYILFCAIYAPLRIAHIDSIQAAAPKLVIGMVEGDIGIWEKEDPNKLKNNLFIHHDLSRQLSLQGVDLIVWPESSYQSAYVWGSRLQTDYPLEHQIDALYAPWFQPQARRIYGIIDLAFGETFRTLPPIHRALTRAMGSAATTLGYTSISPYFPAYVSGFYTPCSEEPPNIMRCPFLRLVPDDLTYYLPSAEPLRDNRRDDLFAQTMPYDMSSPIRGFDAAILFGTLTMRGTNDDVTDFHTLYQASASERQIFNTAHLVDNDGRVLGSYHKKYLLLFGEYIPFADRFPWIYDILPEAGNLTRGTDVKTLPFRDFQIGPIICYENILPRYVRDLSRLRPNVFINITNDAWFGKTSEPNLHMALASLRSVEHRRWLVRSTNTGVSVFVDAAGRIVDRTSIYDPEILRASVAMMPATRTIYSYIGDILGWLSLAWVLALFFLKPRRRKTQGDGMHLHGPLKTEDMA